MARLGARRSRQGTCLGDQAANVVRRREYRAVHLAVVELQVAHAAPGDAPVYLDHCPMYEGGADWLSRDKAIRNPYYGSQMLTCGSVKETIAK